MLVKKKKIQKLLIGSVRDFIKPDVDWIIHNDLSNDPFMESVLEKLNGHVKWSNGYDMVDYQPGVYHTTEKFYYLNNNTSWDGITHGSSNGYPFGYVNVEFEINASQFLKLW